MDHRYRETFKTWNKVAQLYEDRFMDLDLYDSSYDKFCSLNESCDSILEVGCGPGNISKYVMNKLPAIDLLGIDISDNMIQLAKKNVPAAKFKIMDARDINKLNLKFDAIISGFTIPYLSDQDCSKFIQNCAELLRPNGHIYLSFVAGKYEDSGYISGSSGGRTYFYYHEPSSILMNLHGASFELLTEINIPYQKSDSTQEIHTILICTKIL